MFKNQFFFKGFTFEISLVLVAWALAMGMDDGAVLPLKIRLDLAHLTPAVWGMVLPLTICFVFFTKQGRESRFFQPIHQKLSQYIGPEVSSLSLTQILLLSAAAGIGEEVLFRGVLLPLSDTVLVSILFAALHAITIEYFVLALGMSLYLGWVYDHSQNLLVPILIHFVYDAVALSLFRLRQAKQI